MLYLQLDQDRKEFAPGELLSGAFGWKLDRPPKDARLCLFWHTSGKGTEDIGMVEEQKEPSPPAVFESRFEFQLPLGPCSFSGKLITLQWCVELALNRGKEVSRVDILVSPWETEVILPSDTAGTG